MRRIYSLNLNPVEVILVELSRITPTLNVRLLTLISTVDVTALFSFYSFWSQLFQQLLHYYSALDRIRIQQLTTATTTSTTRSLLVTFLLKGQPLGSSNQCQTVRQASASSWAIRIRPKCDCAPNYLTYFPSRL